MHNLILVSIIVPIYNAGKYLNRCLDSLLCQTYNNIEIILIDDGSNDDSLLICNKYKTLDPRVIVIHKSNNGVSSARNTGLKVSKGEWVYFVDSDDWINKDAISSLIFDKMDSRCLYLHQAITVFSNDNSPQKKWPYKYNDCLIEINNVKHTNLFDKVLIYGTPWGKLYNKKILCENNIYFDESIALHEDHCFYLNYISRIDRIMVISSSEYNYWINSNSMSLSSDRTKHNPFKVLYSADLMEKYLNVIIQRTGSIKSLRRINSFICNIRLSALRNAIKSGWSYDKTSRIFQQINTAAIFFNYHPTTLSGKLLKYVFLIREKHIQYFFLKIINKLTNRL